MIAVYDFMNLCIDDDQIYAIYDFSKGDVIFTGTIRELPDELDNYNVVSFDSVTNDKIITINIDSEGDEY